MTNEVEKLRALLAEARAAVHLILDIDALQGWACEGVEDAPPVDDVLRNIRHRIDAALAEPVEPVHPSSLTDVVTMLEQERDEARAAATTAYQRGAEAMREAAAVRIDAEGINGCTGPYFGNIIRALSVPKEES